MDYVVTPDGKMLYDGTIVIIQRFPGMKWILHQGFYSFEGARHTGWYFVSIPNNSTLPLYESDLVGIRIVSPTPCPPGPYPPGPFPPGPYPPGPCPPGPHPPMDYPYTAYDRDSVFRSALTVNNVYELEALKSRPLQNGKIVRVNDYEGRVEYFEWSEDTQSWKLLSLGDRYPDKDYISENYATIESVEELEGRVDLLEDEISHLDWVNIDELVEGLEG